MPDWPPNCHYWKREVTWLSLDVCCITGAEETSRSMKVWSSSTSATCSLLIWCFCTLVVHQLETNKVLGFWIASVPTVCFPVRVCCVCVSLHHFIQSTSERRLQTKGQRGSKVKHVHEISRGCEETARCEQRNQTVERDEETKGLTCCCDIFFLFSLLDYIYFSTFVVFCSWVCFHSSAVLSGWHHFLL